MAINKEHAAEEMALAVGEKPAERGMIEVAQTRAAQEVQAACVIAKKFPRDETVAFARVMRACHRKALAEVAQYAYPRGATTVTGPSIRMAECLAQNWGNIDFGIVELEQRAGESDCMSYAWDLETNSRQTKVFTVKHERHKKNNVVEKLTDTRDIYEMVANQGARRLRACILGIVPGDLVEAAMVECDKTLAGGNAEPLVDRVRAMVTAFAEQGVTVAMLEARLGHVLANVTEQELVTLRKIYGSIRDNFQPVAVFFTPGALKERGTLDLDAMKLGAPPPDKAAKDAPGVPKQPATPPAEPEAADAPADERKPGEDDDGLAPAVIPKCHAYKSLEAAFEGSQLHKVSVRKALKAAGEDVTKLTDLDPYDSEICGAVLARYHETLAEMKRK